MEDGSVDMSRREASFLDATEFSASCAFPWWTAVTRATGNVGTASNMPTMTRLLTLFDVD
jgi:hypothetical protein